MTFNNILDKYHETVFSKKDLGSRFERLMQAYLLTDPKYAVRFKKVWLWNEFCAKDDLGGQDTGIDIVCQTFEDDFWAVQCKCFQEDNYIDKPQSTPFFLRRVENLPTKNCKLSVLHTVFGFPPSTNGLSYWFGRSGGKKTCYRLQSLILTLNQNDAKVL